MVIKLIFCKYKCAAQNFEIKSCIIMDDPLPETLPVQRGMSQVLVQWTSNDELQMERETFQESFPKYV